MSKINLEKALSFKFKGVHTVLIQCPDAFYIPEKENFSTEGGIVDVYAFPGTLHDNHVIAYIPRHKQFTLLPLDDEMKVVKTVTGYSERQGEADAALLSYRESGNKWVKVVKSVREISNKELSAVLLMGLESLAEGIGKGLDMTTDEYQQFLLFADLVSVEVSEESGETIRVVLEKQYKLTLARTNLLESMNAIKVHQEQVELDKQYKKGELSDRTEGVVEKILEDLGEEKAKELAIFVRMKMVATAMLTGGRTMYLLDEVFKSVKESYPLLEDEMIEGPATEGLKTGLKNGWLMYDELTKTYSLTSIGGANAVAILREQAARLGK